MAVQVSTTDTEAYSGIAFSFSEMRQEIDSINTIAEKFLTPDTNTNVLPQWKQRLLNVQNTRPTNATVWEITESEPLRTITTTGTYEPNGKKGLRVYGLLSSIWEIQVDSNPADKNPKEFILLGNASTKISIFEVDNSNNECELARWRFEVGDRQSPGCHFHMQALGDEADVAFPKRFPVPRFPSVLITPMDGLEFLLSEIFQTKWLEWISKEDANKRALANCQRKRLTNLLDWNREIVQSSGSPWSAYKLSKPSRGVLLGKSQR